MQPFHILSPSRWPILISFTLLITVIGLVISWSGLGTRWLIIGLYPTFILIFLWFYDIVKESYLEGFHSKPVQSGLRIGMLLFIVSESMFFFGFFWAYLHCSLSPNIEIGSIWPPTGLVSIPFSGLPLLNTVVLLTSGATVTWSHSSLLIFVPRLTPLSPPLIPTLSWSPTPPPKLLSPSMLYSAYSLFLRILLGILFTFLQAFEYALSPFSIADSSYGSCFYIATGFHGLHVIIGTLFLFFSLFRLINFHFTRERHLGFEFAIWYWHFVDVIWLLLYLVIYCWGS